MKESMISKAYAQALIQLGEEKNINVADELTKLTEVINSSNDLENVLFVDVFTVDEKMAVLLDVMKQLKLSMVSTNFMSFLINEKRIHLFPLIFKEVIVVDDYKRGFLCGIVEGFEDSANERLVEKIRSYLCEKMGIEIRLDYRKNSNITAGYRATVEDLQLDATLENQLNQFKDTVLNA